MTDRASAWPNAILMRLPRSVRGRYLARLVHRAYGIPRPVVLVGMALVILIYIYMGLAAVAAVVDALAPWGPWEWPPGNRFAFSFLGFIVLPSAGSCMVATLAYRRLRLRLLRSQLQELAGSARLRSCPNCAYDQAGTPGVLCPECGCAIAFSRADTAGATLAPGSRCRTGPWPVLRDVLLPGAAAGLAGLLAFGIAHAALIAPIWRRLSGGWRFAQGMSRGHGDSPRRKRAGSAPGRRIAG